MKYVMTEYASEKETRLKRFLRKTGIYNKYEIYDAKILETEGYIVTLPFLQEETDDFDYCLNQTKKVFEYIKKEFGDVEYCLPHELKAVGGRQGVYTSALCARVVFRTVAERLDMKYIRTAIIGKDKKAVMTVLDGIYDGLNYLCVLTQTDDATDKRAREIYSETGLDVIFITGVRNPVFMEADIIINCGMEIEDSINALKTGAVYITFKDNAYIKEERKDINYICLEKIKTKEDVYEADAIEAVLCAKNYYYRNFVDSRYYIDKAERAEGVLKDVVLIDIC